MVIPKETDIQKEIKEPDSCLRRTTNYHSSINEDFISDEDTLFSLN